MPAAEALAPAGTPPVEETGRWAQGSLGGDTEELFLHDGGFTGVDAFSDLYELHWDAGVAFAYNLVQHHANAEDLVSHSFAKILSAVKAGNGPRGPFRPYLYRAIRTSAVDHWRRSSFERPTDIVPETRAEDPGFVWVEESEDRQLAGKAFASIPSRWQHVLQLIDVQQMPPRQAAPILGIEPNAVSALIRRARRGLREAYLIASLGEAPDQDCGPFLTLLAREAMQNASAREQTKLNRHLPGCKDCSRALARLREAHSSMRRL
ncbi:sigma-70 family RNA polymerase sigma factor [Arthrobacter sp. 24S4-2]|uniref:RNA polymerase sigma factor n=1 Tax=Arthrobacter sp. 24S4-2 TaxID=2575374 RepID=UPI0010C7DBEC|nr:sigma-70 family RNA polymerase sigma factor [Arthrobacter sp. 24S4-2]QCO96774.1 sigma-70 family RNA polymerase sigma factor [Arthrobacter sp. 24S4-2]